MLVQNKLSDDPAVIGPETKIDKGLSFLRPKIDSLPLRAYPGRENTIFSTQWSFDSIKGKVKTLQPDIVHLHWIGEGFLKIETIEKLHKPLVWTLHDMWPFTGGCHYTYQDCNRYINSCGACPQLHSSNNRDLSYKVWQRKENSFKNVPLTIVSPSHWLADCARKSSLLQKKRIEVIPNGIDTDIFKPVNKKLARELLNLPVDKHLILFGGMQAINDKRKGFDLLKIVLEKLGGQERWKDKINIVIFGSNTGENMNTFKFKSIDTGQLYDDISLRLLYSAADVLVAPSIMENLPNVVMEALSCGTPCVAFNIGGMPDLIKNQETGYLAVPFSADDLSKGIEWVLSDSSRLERLSMQSRKKVENEFAMNIVAKKYISLYRESIEEFKES